MSQQQYISSTFSEYCIGYCGFGFNGKENDNEVKGIGNSLDFGARIYDSRTGRFLSIDRLSKSFPSESNYIFAGNNPIRNIDVDGNFKLDPKDAAKYPHLAAYLKNNIKEISKSEDIMNALKEYTRGNLTPSQVESDLIYDSGPQISFNGDLYDGARGYTPGCGREGLFEGFTINSKLAQNLEDVMKSSNSTENDKQAALLDAMATILHEYVHYGDAMNCNGDYQTEEGDEEGVLFVKKVYGRQIGYDENKGTIIPDTEGTKKVIEEKSKSEKGKKVLPTVPKEQTKPKSTKSTPSNKKTK